MKKILLIAIMLIMCQVVAFASEKNIDLKDYQQAPGTINVLSTSFDGNNSYLATFNFEQKEQGDKINFYQGTCLVDQKDNETLLPLSVKKIKGNSESFSEVILDKKDNAPHKQDFRTVQTTREADVAYLGGDSTDLVMLGNFKVKTSAGTFDDCIGVKIYNKTTGEGMVQYLAKGYGVVYIEGVKSDGSKVEIARLQETRNFNNEDIKWFKDNYFV